MKKAKRTTAAGELWLPQIIPQGNDIPLGMGGHVSLTYMVLCWSLVHDLTKISHTIVITLSSRQNPDKKREKLIKTLICISEFPSIIYIIKQTIPATLVTICPPPSPPLLKPIVLVIVSISTLSIEVFLSCSELTKIIIIWSHSLWYSVFFFSHWIFPFYVCTVCSCSSLIYQPVGKPLENCLEK